MKPPIAYEDLLRHADRCWRRRLLAKAIIAAVTALLALGLWVRGCLA